MFVLETLPVYVVSVKSFIDRHALIRGQAEQHGLNLEFIWEFDADTLTDNELVRFVREGLPHKSMSCVLKHLEAQRRLLASDQEICLVLEDDALLGDNFVHRLAETLELAQVLTGPWLIFLGGMDNALDERFFAHQELSLIESPLTTAEAYLLNRSGCRARAGWLKANLINKAADHLLKDMDRQLAIPQYRVSKPFVSQGSITGRFATSLDASRGRKPAWYLRIRYHWNRFRKQQLPAWLAYIK